MTISKNIIKETSSVGISGYDQGLGNENHDIVIQENTITSDPDGSTGGIFFNGISKSTVVKNNIAGNYQLGILLRDSGGASKTFSSFNTISLNTITKTGGGIMTGIYLESGSSMNLVKNNNFSGVDLPIIDQGTLNKIIP